MIINEHNYNHIIIIIADKLSFKWIIVVITITIALELDEWFKQTPSKKKVNCYNQQEICIHFSGSL